MSTEQGSVPLVLIADDEPPNRELLRTFLTQGGYRVVEASGGAEAVELARAQRPALAILDVRMAGMDGFETAARLRADPATRAMKIALISAANRDDDRARAREAGADTYLYKLMRWTDIMAEVNRLLGRD